MEDWNQLIGEEVQILKKSFVDESLAQPVTLRLVEAMQLGAATPAQDSAEDDSQSPLSLCFEGDQQILLESATYEVSHPAFGKCDLFINEIEPEPDSKFRRFETILS